MAVENTDLERRVLAHEQILQVLIAHVAKSEPSLLARMRDVFIERQQQGVYEHDYTDTAGYAEQFIRGTIVLGHASAGPVPSPAASPRPLGPNLLAPAATPTPLGAPLKASRTDRRAASVFQGSLSAGIWYVTKDGAFYGDYRHRKAALDAVNAAVRTIEASGGSARAFL